MEGQHDWVKLWDVHRHVAQENPSATLGEVQSKTIDVIRALVGEGLAEVGDLRDHGARFEPWGLTADESMRRITSEYVERFNDRAGWPWTLWLRITNAGKRVGSSYESEYRRWVSENGEQGCEDDPLPQKFEPQC